MLCFFFFFKQKTAYGVPIRDWDSNVCSSDLRTTRVHQLLHLERPHLALAEGLALGIEQAAVRPAEDIRRQRLPQPVLLQQRAQAAQGALARRRRGQAARSEEHTSELKSLMRIQYAVFCLKKTTKHLTTS